MKLDVPTLFMGTLCFEVFVAMTLLVYGRHRRVYPGFWLYAGSMFAVSACYLGLMVRPFVPLPASVLIVAGCTFLASILRLDAIRRFVDWKALPRALYLFPPAAGLAFAALAWAGSPQATRAALQSVLFTGFVILGIEAFLMASTVDRPLRVTAAALLAAQPLAMVGRAVASWFLPQVGPMDPSLIHGSFYSLTMVSECGLAAVFVLMNSARLERDLVASSQELALAGETLQKNLERLQILQGFLSICAHCKKVRVSKETWEAVEVYVSRHSDLEFSPELCEKCMPSRDGELGRDLGPAPGGQPWSPHLPGTA